MRGVCGASKACGRWLYLGGEGRASGWMAKHSISIENRASGDCNEAGRFSSGRGKIVSLSKKGFR